MAADDAKTSKTPFDRFNDGVWWVPDGEGWRTPTPGEAYREIKRQHDEIERLRDRTPAGRVFLELAVRFHNAAREHDAARVASLLALIDSLEAEFPVEVAAERALYASL